MRKSSGSSRAKGPSSPWTSFHVSRSLAKTLRQDRFRVSADEDFDAVLDECAAPGPSREKTWINPPIRKLYRALYDLGVAHTIECRRDGELVGGLYGVALGAAFFGESMFHREPDASKVALAHLVARLRAGGFKLLDTQFMTTHLASLGAREVSRETYRKLLAAAIEAPGAEFWVWPRSRHVRGAEALAALVTPARSGLAFDTRSGRSLAG